MSGVWGPTNRTQYGSLLARQSQGLMEATNRLRLMAMAVNEPAKTTLGQQAGGNSTSYCNYQCVGVGRSVLTARGVTRRGHIEGHTGLWPRAEVTGGNSAR